MGYLFRLRYKTIDDLYVGNVGVASDAFCSRPNGYIMTTTNVNGVNDAIARLSSVLSQYFTEDWFIIPIYIYDNGEVISNIVKRIFPNSVVVPNSYLSRLCDYEGREFLTFPVGTISYYPQLAGNITAGNRRGYAGITGPVSGSTARGPECSSYLTNFTYNFTGTNGRTEVRMHFAVNPETIVSDNKLNLDVLVGQTPVYCYVQISIENGDVVSCYIYKATETFSPISTVSNIPGYSVMQDADAPTPGPDPQPDDPFAGGGTSEPGGGGGTFDADSDQIPDSSLPSLSVADTGFARVYNPTLAQLKSLAEYMWTSDSFLETLLNHAKQLIEDPMNAIISLNLLPCPIPNGSPVDVKVLYINTGVQMSPATTQFVDVDCGSVELNRYYGSALDYSPYTKVSLFLPYIGQVTLDVDEIMNRTVNVKYRIDIVSGMCVAKVLVDGNVMYQFSGHCAINMPLNSADFSGYIGALVQAAKVGTTVVAGAAGGAPAAAAVAGLSPGRSSTSTTTTTVRNPATGRQITAGTERQSRSTAPASWGEIANKTISNSVSAVMGSKTIVEHAGSFSGNSGYLGVRRPYLIIERPRMCNPAEYGQLNGYPSLLTLEFSSLKGYTEVQEVQLTGLSATNPELSELSLLLKGGVIF